MLTYNHDPGNPALEPKLTVEMDPRDREIMELILTQNALLDEIAKLHRETSGVLEGK